MIQKWLVILSLCFVQPAKADMFGGDLIYLAQILAKSIEQIAQLQAILKSSKSNLEFLQELNRGINDSLYLISTINPNIDPGLYKEWKKVSDALNLVTGIYGTAVDSKENRVQTDTDQTVAEAITLNNSIYDYTRKIDEIAETIKRESHNVSPGGAQKLTAQSLGVMMHIQTETLRAQATGLKIQAQALAVQNRKDKEQSKQVVSTAEKLEAALTAQQPQFILPKF
jgi:hypothetical protein